MDAQKSKQIKLMILLIIGIIAAFAIRLIQYRTIEAQRAEQAREEIVETQPQAEEVQPG